MGAMKRNTLTINAGVDMIIISNGVNGRTVDYIIDTIVALVEQGTIPRSRIYKSD